MATPYIGEIRIFAGNFAPVGWAFCNGASIPIDQNDALFNLIGTTYGGNGTTTFNLPDLQGRIPLMAGSLSLQNFALGQKAGAESTTLNVANLPAHAHLVNADGANSNSTSPANTVPGSPPAGATPTYYKSAPATPTTMAANAITGGGGGQPISIIQPVLAVNFIISLFGIFPTQN